MCSSVKVERKNPKSEKWNDKGKVTVERRDAVWKGELGVRKGIVKEAGNVVGCLKSLRKLKSAY